MKRLSLTLVALVAAGVVLFLAAAPNAPQRLDPSSWADLAGRTVAGAYHVHTLRSDGYGDREAVAAAAARAGLRFVILTDHGDGTGPPDPPLYLSGVLVLDGVEISTGEGHYVALDMPRAPYPLGGAADTVVEDVARLGGFGIAAHPDSAKPALRWTDDRAPVDGLEWLNTDSEWRDDSRWRIARALLGYFLRPGPALASLFERPVTLARWDRMTRVRQVVALAGADAHGGVGRRAEDTGRTMAGAIGVPGYEASFRAFSNRVILDRGLTGEAAADGRAILDAIRQGRVYTSIDAVASPAVLDLYVETGGEKVQMGGRVTGSADAAVIARGLLPAGAGLVLLHDGGEVASGREIRYQVTARSGAYRVEARLPGSAGSRDVPWLVSNPIYFVPGPSPSPAAPPSISGRPIPPFPWRIEKDPTSSGILRIAGSEATLEYRLGPGGRSGQFVALATDPGSQRFQTIELSLAGDRPLRVSVQVRKAGGGRWGRSFYIDPAGTTLRVPLSSLQRIGEAPAAGPPLSSLDVTSLLVVLDLTNAAPGHAGSLRVLSSALLN